MGNPNESLLLDPVRINETLYNCVIYRGVVT